MLAEDSVPSLQVSQGLTGSTHPGSSSVGGIDSNQLPAAERHRARPTEFAVAAVAQLAERVLGKDEVMGSTPISSFAFQTAWVRAKRPQLEQATVRHLAIVSTE